MKQFLYRGSNLAVRSPRILTPNRFLDFGNGFYTTSNPEQAKNFAEKVTVRKKEGVSTVSVYDFDESSLSKLDVLSFDGADEAWLDFVSANRNGTAPESSHDLIKGPVADDDVFSVPFFSILRGFSRSLRRLKH